MPKCLQKMSLCYSITQHFHQTFMFKSQSPIFCSLAKWLATAVPLAVHYAAASSSSMHELLLFPAKFELCFCYCIIIKT